MALPLIASLGSSIARALPIIEGGVARGLSSHAINDLIAETFGQGVRRTNLLTAIRAVKGIEQAGNTLKYVRKDRLPNLDKLPSAITKTLRKYSFKVKIRGIFPSTGELVTQYISVAINNPVSISQVEDIALSAIATGQSGSTVDVTDVFVVSAVKSDTSIGYL